MNNVIQEVNLTDEEINELLMENYESNEVFAENFFLKHWKYNDTISTIARIIGKHFNQESLNLFKKKRN